MSFLSKVESFFVTTEADVVTILAKVKQAVQVAEHDIATGLQWIAGHAPQIAADLQQAESIIVTLGVANDPRVAAAITAANLAVAGINKVAADVKAGQTTVQTLVDGYAAYKQAQASAALASSAAAASLVPAAA
ncbi:hypothetical protein M2322_002662 [Rhodoblastus acidophilus]|uniref:hypothetical protein n=1 Tax=Rhodoblastus acidophilus TaxID=1074 RepID=UPI00222516D0|nr:hypothetical protein [Rhodoblastus acidophilus]MCW2317108.1 hypothetical protein [Rhodoblastus acidophilus]